MSNHMVGWKDFNENDLCQVQAERPAGLPDGFPGKSSPTVTIFLCTHKTPEEDGFLPSSWRLFLLRGIE